MIVQLMDCVGSAVVGSSTVVVGAVDAGLVFMALCRMCGRMCGVTGWTASNTKALFRAHQCSHLRAEGVRDVVCDACARVDELSRALHEC